MLFNLKIYPLKIFIVMFKIKIHFEFDLKIYFLVVGLIFRFKKVKSY